MVESLVFNLLNGNLQLDWQEHVTYGADGGKDRPLGSQ